jgi:Ca2+-binding EF-hand superfamily protein
VPNSLTEANLAALFAALDTTGDGCLSATDFKTRADQACAALAPDPSTPEHQAIQTAHAAYWKQLHLSANASGAAQLRQAEFIAAVRSGLTSDPRYLDVVATASAAVFDAADADRDGSISREEFTRYYQAVGRDADTTNIAFDKLDTDGDGAISRQEVIAGTRAMLTSQDPSVPGTWMLGRTSAH